MKLQTIPAVLLALSLSSCGGLRDSAPSAPAPLTQGQGEGVGLALSDALTQVLEPFQGASVSPSEVGALALSAQGTFPACYTPATPPTDSDGDGIPDSATYTLNCARSGPAYSVKRTGTWAVSDPSSDPAVKGFDASVNTVLERLDKSSGQTTRLTSSGSFAPRASGNVLSLSPRLSSTRQVGGQPQATLESRLNLTYTADAPIDFRRPIGAGTLAVGGSIVFVRSDVGTLNFAVSTPTPLRYDPSCADDLQVVGGVLRLEATSPSSAGFVRVAFGACGTTPRVLVAGLNV